MSTVSAYVTGDDRTACPICLNRLSDSLLSIEARSVADRVEDVAISARGALAEVQRLRGEVEAYHGPEGAAPLVPAREMTSVVHQLHSILRELEEVADRAQGADGPRRGVGHATERGILHLAHRDCLLTHLENDPRCPICRIGMNIEDFLLPIERSEREGRGDVAEYEFLARDSIERREGQARRGIDPNQEWVVLWQSPDQANQEETDQEEMLVADDAAVVPRESAPVLDDPVPVELAALPVPVFEAPREERGTQRQRIVMGVLAAAYVGLCYGLARTSPGREVATIARTALTNTLVIVGKSSLVLGQAYFGRAAALANKLIR